AAARDAGSLVLGGRLITPEQLEEVRRVQERTGGDIGEIMVERGLITPVQLLQARAHLYGLKPIDGRTAPGHRAAGAQVPERIARQHYVLPIHQHGDLLIVAVTDPTNVLALHDLRSASGVRIQMVLGEREAIDEAIAKYYGEPE